MPGSPSMVNPSRSPQSRHKLARSESKGIAFQALHVWKVFRRRNESCGSAPREGRCNVNGAPAVASGTIREQYGELTACRNRGFAAGIEPRVLFMRDGRGGAVDRVPPDSRTAPLVELSAIKSLDVAHAPP